MIRPDNLVRGVGRRDGGSDGLRLSLDECEALRSQGKSRRRNGLLGHEHIERSGHIADLDGNLLIANDRFKGMEVVEGKITLNDLPGIGVEKIG